MPDNKQQNEIKFGAELWDDIKNPLRAILGSAIIFITFFALDELLLFLIEWRTKELRERILSFSPCALCARLRAPGTASQTRVSYSGVNNAMSRVYLSPCLLLHPN